MPLKIIPSVIAHRGASAYAPENIFSAFLLAKKLGVNWVEFDVRLTQDEDLIVFHDDELDRTTNATGLVRDHPLSYLKTLDAGSWFSPNFIGETIPTFQETLTFLYHHGLSANIELKASVGEEKLIAKKIVKILEKMLEKNSFHFLISSFSRKILAEVKQLNDTFPLGFLMDEWLINWEDVCDRLNCVSVNVNYKILNKKKVEKILASNRQVIAYTVNNPKNAKKLFSWGVSALFSDCPDKILAMLPNNVKIE